MEYMSKGIKEIHDDLVSGKVISEDLVRESLEKSHALQEECNAFVTILDDAKVVSETASDKAQKLDGIVDGISSSVGTVVNSIKGNQNVVSAATSMVNAASSLAGVVKKPAKKVKKK